MSQTPQKPLVVLVPDRNVEYTIQELLTTRHKALGISPIIPKIYSHPAHDSGCLGDAHHFLKPWTKEYTHALVLFDREGCGRENLTSVELETQVKTRLADNGWDVRAEVIVFDPELEQWVWSNSPHIDKVVGWKDTRGNLKDFLVTNGFWEKQQSKPTRPKEAFEYILRQTQKSRSSALYKQLAAKVSLEKCTDSAFLKLKETLKNWFGV